MDQNGSKIDEGEVQKGIFQCGSHTVEINEGNIFVDEVSYGKVNNDDVVFIDAKSQVFVNNISRKPKL